LTDGVLKTLLSKVNLCMHFLDSRNTCSMCADPVGQARHALAGDRRPMQAQAGRPDEAHAQGAATVDAEIAEVRTVLDGAGELGDFGDCELRPITQAQFDRACRA